MSCIKYIKIPSEAMPKIACYRPFPAALFSPKVSSFIQEASASIGCDAAYVGLPLLAALASAVGMTREIELKPDWCEPCVIWSIVIGESGTHKTPALRKAVEVVENEQARLMRRYEQAMVDHEANPLGEQPPVLERVLCKDITIEALADRLAHSPRGLLVMRDELSGWFGSFDAYKNTNMDVAQWLELFNAQALTVDRKSGDKKTLYIPRAGVSLTGSIQPSILMKSLGSKHLENGLAARFLMAKPDRQLKQWRNVIMSKKTTDGLESVFRRLWSLDFNQTESGELRPISLKLSADGLAAFIKFYNRHALEQHSLGGHLSAVWSKLEGYCGRLALLSHLLRWAEDDPTLVNANEVDSESIDRAEKLVQWFGYELKRIYALMDESEMDRILRKTLELVAAKGCKLSKRDLMRAGPCIKSVMEVDELFNWLTDNNYGHITTQQSQNGGRPKLVNSVSL